MSRKILLSHLAAVELHSANLDASVAFFQNVMGMQVTARAGD